MRKSPEVEAAAIAGTPAECRSPTREVIAAGAQLILFTPLFAQAEHLERLASEVMPGLGAGTSG